MYANDKKPSIKGVLQREILPSISSGIGDIIERLPENLLTDLEEIRIRLNKPLMIVSGGRDRMLAPSGEITVQAYRAYCVTREDCENTLQLLCNFSLYAAQQELKNGYITLKGGHRVGIVGSGIVEGGNIKALKNISGFNIRISREVIGAADKVLRYVMKDRENIYNTLIISPPQCGKTTLLRDMIRQLSSGPSGMKVALVDERSEIAGSYMGAAQNDVGLRTDVLDACPKSSGIIMVIRSMSPKIVATDEIGSSADVGAIYEAMNAGVKIITTIHGDGLEDILNRPFIDEVVKNRTFERLIVLSSRFGPGTVEEIIDTAGFRPVADVPFR